MTRETLSAALDGECSREELDRLLSELERSPQLRLEWSRWCLARDALAGAAVRPDQPSICASVMSALEAEEQPSGKVVALAPRRRTFAWRPLVGLATAASVASVAFYLGYHSPAIPVAGMVAKAATAATTLTGAPQLVAADGAAARPALSRDQRHSGWDSLPDEDAQQLNNYLIDYSTYRAGSGMSNTLGYARFAAHTAEYSPDSH